MNLEKSEYKLCLDDGSYFADYENYNDYANRAGENLGSSLRVLQTDPVGAALEMVLTKSRDFVFGVIKKNGEVLILNGVVNGQG